MGGLWATKSEGVGLIVRAITFQDFLPADPPTPETDGQTDRQTDDMQSQHRAMHRSASLYHRYAAWLSLRPLGPELTVSRSLSAFTELVVMAQGLELEEKAKGDRKRKEKEKKELEG